MFGDAYWLLLKCAYVDDNTPLSFVKLHFNFISPSKHEKKWVTLVENDIEGWLKR